MATLQHSGQPLVVAMEFIKRINSGDVESICQLMTADHVFQDALGKRFLGRDKMRAGWEAYFKVVSDYRVYAEEFFQTDDRMAIFGRASGVYAAASGSSSTNFWEIPAAWRAVIRDGLIAEWRVYADNQPLRKLMGQTQP